MAAVPWLSLSRSVGRSSLMGMRWGYDIRVRLVQKQLRNGVLLLLGEGEARRKGDTYNKYLLRTRSVSLSDRRRA